MDTRKRRQAPTSEPSTPATPFKRKAPPARSALLAPDARWQRFQRYVWDRKKG